MKSDLST